MGEFWKIVELEKIEEFQENFEINLTNVWKNLKN